MAQALERPLVAPPPPRVVPGSARSSRFAPLDALRGLAVVLMALDHAAWFSRVSIQAEHNADQTTVLGSGILFAIGLLTNIAAPTFWFVGGVSVALLAMSSRRRHGSEWPATRFLLARAGLLVLLDLTLIPILWELRQPFHFGYVFDLLSSIAVSLVILSALRWLPGDAIAALMLVVLGTFPSMVASLPPGPHPLWVRAWVEYGYQQHPGVPFPVLGWLPLMGLGYALGGHLHDRRLARPGAWLAIGAALLAAWLVLRVGRGWGSSVPWDPSQSWEWFLVMSKGPPSVDFLCFNLGLASLIYAALFASRQRLQHGVLRALVVFGRASLFVYVVHLVLYLFLGRVGTRVLPHHGTTRYLLVWAAGMALLVPLAAVYRRFKQAHPRSPLRFL